VGDTWWNGIYPFIDYSTGGSIDGSIRAAEANLRAVTSKTIVIPGHGPVGGKSEMTEFRDMLVAIREKVAALKKQAGLWMRRSPPSRLPHTTRNGDSS